MDYIPGQLLIDNAGNVITVKSVITMLNRTTKVSTQTIEVFDSSKLYKPSDLQPLTDEQYQEYIKQDDEEE